MSGGLGGQLTVKLHDTLDPLLHDLGELWKTEVKEAVEDLAHLVLQKMAAHDPLELVMLDREILHATARIKNWEFVGADLVRAAILAGFKTTLELGASVLKGLIK